MRKARNIVVRIVHIMVGHSHKGMSKHHRRCRHAIGMSIGTVIILTGTAVASSGVVNPIFADAVGYFIHAVGCIPFISNIDPLYRAMVEV